MKKFISYLTCILIFSALLFSAGCSGNAQEERIDSLSPSWNNTLSGTCPKGLSYDPNPGVCGSYIDFNSDGFCDRSQ